MARRDFALNEAPSRPQGSAASALMPVMAILMVALLCFAAGYWLGQTQAPTVTAPEPADMVSKAEYANLKARFVEQQKQLDDLGAELEKWKAIANRDASSRVGTLQFYDTLPKQPVMPAPLTPPEPALSPAASAAGREGPAAVPPAEPDAASGDMLADIIGREMQRSSSGIYRIQAGSFRSLSEARPLQQRLEAAGFASFTEPVDLGAKGRWLRVYVGPYESRAKAERVRNKLQQKLKISGLLTRKKG